MGRRKARSEGAHDSMVSLPPHGTSAGLHRESCGGPACPASAGLPSQPACLSRLLPAPYEAAASRCPGPRGGKLPSFPAISPPAGSGFRAGGKGREPERGEPAQLMSCRGAGRSRAARWPGQVRQGLACGQRAAGGPGVGAQPACWEGLRAAAFVYVPGQTWLVALGCGRMGWRRRSRKPFYSTG